MRRELGTATILWALLTALSAFNSVLAAAPRFYRVVEIPTFGGDDAEAHAVNIHGEVVGWSKTPDGNFRAFLYGNGEVSDLGTLGGLRSQAFDINGSGQVVGESETASGERHAFLYQNGSMIDLGTLGGAYSIALGINSQGHVVGAADLAGEPRRRHAFLWADGTMVDLGTLGGALSTAWAINDGDDIVGEAQLDVQGCTYPFLFRGGFMLQFPTDGACGVAFDINGSGEAVGSVEAHPSPEVIFRPVLFTLSGAQDLGTLGGSSGDALAINNDGDIVGDSETGDLSPSGASVFHAFLYSNGQMNDLSDRVRPRREIEFAFDINDLGQIVATTLSSGAPRLYLLTPRRHLRQTLP